MAVLLNILKMVIGVASPEIREMLKAWIVEFQTKAAETPNPWDDLLALILKAIIVGDTE